jgi:tetratricopeptide (TPR) repeat protein
MESAGKVTPRFVVHVQALLSAGNTGSAIEACRAGIVVYPWYGTGYWLLGKCLEAQGNAGAAHEQYQRAAAVLPGVAALKAALARTGGRTVEGPKVDMDALLVRLQQARRSKPPQAVENTPLVDISEPLGEQGIATVTLAEILAQQGKYREALEAYRRVIGQRPDDAGRHAARVAELEELLQRADKLREP